MQFNGVLIQLQRIKQAEFHSKYILTKPSMIQRSEITTTNLIFVNVPEQLCFVYSPHFD